jgi:hypothetical protein
MLVPHGNHTTTVGVSEMNAPTASQSAPWAHARPSPDPAPHQRRSAPATAPGDDEAEQQRPDAERRDERPVREDRRHVGSARPARSYLARASAEARPGLRARTCT